MSLRPFTLLCLVAAALAGVVGLELASNPPAPAPAPVGASAVQAVPSAAQDPAAGYQVALLSRPPFSPDRRPPPGQVAAADNGLPRLTGTIVTAEDRRAIFDAPDGRKSIVLREGEQIGAYRVQTIGPAKVSVGGPGGVYDLQPRFSSVARAAPASAPAALAAGFAPGLPPLPPTAGPLGFAIYGNMPLAPAAPPPGTPR